MPPYACWVVRLISLAALVALAGILPGGAEKVSLAASTGFAVAVPESWLRLGLCILSALVGIGLSGPTTLALDMMLGSAAIAFTVWAVGIGLVAPPRGVMLAVFSVVGAVAIHHAILWMEREPIEIESHWGGLGGGLGGWRLSGPVVLLLIGGLCVTAAALIMAPSSASDNAGASAAPSTPRGK